MSELKLRNPYEETKKAGIKSEKDRTHFSFGSNRTDEENTWDTKGKDPFGTHPLARKAHVYGSSLK